MKCRIKLTGEVVNVFSCSANGTYTDYSDSHGEIISSKLNYYKDLEPIVENELTSEIDWENRRYEIAKAAMQGVLSSGKYGSCGKVIADSFVYADMFIKQLKQSNEAK